MYILFGGGFVGPPRLARPALGVGACGGFVYPSCLVRSALGVGVCGGFVYPPCLLLVAVRVWCCFFLRPPSWCWLGVGCVPSLFVLVLCAFGGLVSFIFVRFRVLVDPCQNWEVCVVN